MELRIEELPGNVTRAIPAGRWDVKGAAAIDLRLSALAGSGRLLIIDLAEVSYLSSMGIRSMVMCAKATGLRGGRLVLLSPAASVEIVLKLAGIDTLIPIHYDIAEALLALQA